MPDGATAESHSTDETAEAPRTDAPPPSGEESEPPPPDDQIDAEIMTAETREWLGGMFGFDLGIEHQSGGGGAGGQFMFADRAELDAVIAQWETQLEEIQADQERIVAAYREIAEPAGDEMSRAQADATRNSLVSMWEHCSQMALYAEGYIEKLKLGRGDMDTMEEDAETIMRTTYQV